MTIEELVQFQAKEGLGDDHLVWLGPDKWVCAHTNAERSKGIEAMADCPLNDWLDSWGLPPEDPYRIYIVVPYDDDWEFLSLDEGN